MKRVTIQTPAGKKTIPVLGTANTDLAHARIYSRIDAKEMIRAGRMRAALERLREGQWPNPEEKLLHLLAEVLSDYKLFRHWRDPAHPPEPPAGRRRQFTGADRPPNPAQDHQLLPAAHNLGRCSSAVSHRPTLRRKNLSFHAFSCCVYGTKGYK